MLVSPVILNSPKSEFDDGVHPPREKYNYADSIRNTKILYRLLCRKETYLCAELAGGSDWRRYFTFHKRRDEPV